MGGGAQSTLKALPVIGKYKMSRMLFKSISHAHTIIVSLLSSSHRENILDVVVT